MDDVEESVDEGEDDDDVEENPKVEWLQMDDDKDELEGEDDDNDDELGENPKVEWLQMDDENSDVDDIYINSAGYYKRV